MGYIGAEPATSFETVRKDRFTSQTGTTVTLSHTVSSVNDILVMVNSVKQDYTNYSVNGTTLTLGGSLVSADIVEVTYIGRTFQTVSPDTNTITNAMMSDDAIDSAELVDGSVDISHLSATGTKSSSTFLAGDNSFKTVSGTTINNNADNKVITGSGTANTLEGEANLTYNGTILGVGASADLGVGLHIKTADSGASVAADSDELVIEGSGASGLSILSGNTSNGKIAFNDNGGNSRGAFIYEHDGDNLRFQTAATDAMKIDSAGIITKALQPAALYSANNGSNFTGDGTQGTVGQTAGMGLTERWDNNADSTDGIFTAPVTGRYLISGQVWIEGIASNHDNLTITMETSNRSYYVSVDPHELGRASANSMGLPITALADMDANDTHVLKISVGGGSKVVDLVDLTTLGITLLC